MAKKLFYLLLITTIVAIGCKKLYTPEVNNTTTNFLVVEGMINSGADSTFIKLSRTTPLNTASAMLPETGAKIAVEGDDETAYNLKESPNGIYFSPGLILNNQKKYRLRITTSDGEVYLSDFEPVKMAPPIDSIGYTIKSDGLQIYSNAHDGSNNTRYYRFDFDEAWKFHTAFISNLEVVDRQVVPRENSVFFCYANNKSSNVIIGSTAKLSQDVLNQQPITFIPSESIKISDRYTILLRQYAITQGAYNFWEELKKNTESVGSIFDALPSESSGNIKCITTPQKKVIGYVSIGTAQSKRVFIDKLKLPLNWKVNYGCAVDTLTFEYGNDKLLYNVPPELIALDSAFDDTGAHSGYTASRSVCADCTTTGHLKKPAFWKDF